MSGGSLGFERRPAGGTPTDATLAAAWDVGFKMGQDYERSLWHWSAGSLSRAVNGLKERPTAPKNPYLHREQS